MKNSITITGENRLPEAVAWLDGWLAAKKSNVVALYGAMGVGKTTFVSALARARGSIQKASSPTFAIVNAYDVAAGDVMYHFDFYRIDDLREAMDLGFFDYIDSGSLCIIEWPERVEPLLAELIPLRILITMNPTNSERTFSVQTDGSL